VISLSRWFAHEPPVSAVGGGGGGGVLYVVGGMIGEIALSCWGAEPGRSEMGPRGRLLRGFKRSPRQILFFSWGLLKDWTSSGAVDALGLERSSGGQGVPSDWGSSPRKDKLVCVSNLAGVLNNLRIFVWSWVYKTRVYWVFSGLPVWFHFLTSRWCIMLGFPLLPGGSSSR